MIQINDLTIFFLTANKVPENWARFHREKLLEAIGDTNIISFSYKPIDLGINIIQEEYNVSNIYKQELKGAKIAKTPYIAIVDDDTLYPTEHLTELRPPSDKISYNINRWHILEWDPTFYFLKNRPGNGLMIAPRELMISIIEKRLRYIESNGELPHKLTKELGTVGRDKYGIVEFYSSLPVISIYHQYSCDIFCRRKKERVGNIKAYDIPKWGHVKDIIKEFK